MTGVTYRSVGLRQASWRSLLLLDLFGWLFKLAMLGVPLVDILSDLSCERDNLGGLIAQPQIGHQCYLPATRSNDATDTLG